MPRIKRSDLPRPVLEHLYQQAIARQLSVDDLILLRRWLDTSPEVPHGPWFKRFSTFTLCGEGALPKTFLLAEMVPWGDEVR
jgi:hypothetical protein